MLAIDFAPSFALPHVVEMPSPINFPHSLAVNILGIYSATERKQHNFVYTERTGGKGSNEVISILNSHLTDLNPSTEVLTVYADESDGQSTNNDVMKYLLLLAHARLYKEATLKLFVRGHNKNASYHDFGVGLARRDVWTLQQVEEALETATVVPFETIREDDEKMTPFSDFSGLVRSMYEDIVDVWKYHIFRASHTEPGVVECFEDPSSPGVKFDLRRGQGMSAKRALSLYKQVKALRKRSVNATSEEEVR